MHLAYSCNQYTAKSIRVALGIGNCALRSYCLVVTQVNHFIVPYKQCPITNDQLSKQPFLIQLYTSLIAEFEVRAINYGHFFFHTAILVEQYTKKWDLDPGCTPLDNLLENRYRNVLFVFLFFLFFFTKYQCHVQSNSSTRTSLFSFQGRPVASVLVYSVWCGQGSP